MNGVIKTALRKLISQHQDVFWDDMIDDLKVGLRFSVNTVHGYCPTDIVYK